MTMVSIDIGAMESLVADMTRVYDHRPADVSTIRGRLDYVLLGTGPVSQVESGTEIWTWMGDRIRDLNRRLTLARLIAGSTPGIPGVGVVEIDEDYVSELSQSAVDDLADEAAELMATDELSGDIEDIDSRLLELLSEHGHDPYFAQAIAERVSPQELDSFLRGVNRYREFGAMTEEEVIEFDPRYDSLLNGLGMTFGLASQGEGPLEVPGMAEAWADHVGEAPAWSGAAQRLTLVTSRGAFSTDLLLTLHERMIELEGDRGPEHWASMDFVYDPDLERSPGSNLIFDPLATLYQGMGHNPDALRQVFAEGETTMVETDDGEVEVNAHLWEVMRFRGMDEYAVEQLVTGLQSGLVSPPVEGEDAWQPGLGEDLQAIAGAIEREARIAEENKPPWWSAAGHFVLDIVGMIPVVGEAADGLNGLWYTAEGDYLNAGLSYAGMVPFVGWFAVGGKWVKRALSAEEMATIGRLADSGVDVGRMLPNGTIGDLTDPATFRPDTFLSPGEMQRFSDRPWLQNMIAGNRFDDYMAPNYRYNELYLDAPGGSGYVRLDSYVPGEDIISRKLTQLGDVQPSTAFSYIDELVAKYPPGSTVADVPSTRLSGLSGQTLEGRLVLQIPPQNGVTIPDEVAEYAFENGVRIIDINGFDYTAHLYP